MVLALADGGGGGLVGVVAGEGGGVADLVGLLAGHLAGGLAPAVGRVGAQHGGVGGEFDLLACQRPAFCGQLGFEDDAVPTAGTPGVVCGRSTGVRLCPKLPAAQAGQAVRFACIRQTTPNGRRLVRVTGGPRRGLLR